MKENIVRSIKFLLKAIPVVIVVLCSFFILSSKVELPFGIRVFTVVSGSMEPNIHTGSIIFSQRQPDYHVGNAITFQPDITKSPTTHRIIEEKEINHVTYYKVKGDANNAPDQSLVKKSTVIGKEIVTIPLLGYFFALTKSLPGMVILVVIPAVIIIYSEILSIKKQIQILIKKRKALQTT